ncbi:MAG: hypothetical protein RL385_469 [Pseudomonadota bacterium]|jgi:hypothetical protein
MIANTFYTLAISLTLCACNFRQVLDDPIGSVADAAAEAVQGPVPETRVCLIYLGDRAVCMMAHSSAALEDACDGKDVPGGCATPSERQITCSGSFSTSQTFSALAETDDMQAVCRAIFSANGVMTAVCTPPGGQAPRTCLSQNR